MYCKKAISLDSNGTFAYVNLGHSQRVTGRLNEAISSYKKAIYLNSDLAEAHKSLGFCYLQLLDFRRGFEEYEWRWKYDKQVEHIGGALKTSKPRWGSEKDICLLVWPEQGLGDEIMFASLFSELRGVVSKLLVKVDKRLVPLFKRSFSPEVQFFEKDTIIPEADYDYHIPMGSLPRYFRRDLEDFKDASEGFLKADRLNAEKLRKKLCPNEGDTLIGISWRSHSSARGGHRKSVDIQELLCRLDRENFKFVNLQYGDVSQELKGTKVMQVDEIDNTKDLDKLADLISACDFVISVSNVTVHLAGALGVPTKVLLPFSWDWRWGTDQTDSYWYKSLKLYRQDKIGDWTSALKKLQKDLCV